MDWRGEESRGRRVNHGCVLLCFFVLCFISRGSLISPGTAGALEVSALRAAAAQRYEGAFGPSELVKNTQHDYLHRQVTALLCGCWLGLEKKGRVVGG